MTDLTDDLQEFMRIIKKRSGLILCTCLGAVIIALLVNFSTSPTYEAVTSMRIKPSRGLADSLLSSWPGSSPLITKQMIGNYAEILKSRTVAQEVISKVYGDKENPPTPESIINSINIQPAKDSDIFYIKVQASSPDEAQMLANTFSDTLVSFVASEQGLVREFIGQRLIESKQELEKAEEALEKYKRDNKMIAPDVHSNVMIGKMSEIDKLAAENSVNMATAQAKLSSAQGQLAGEKPGFVADNPLIQQYKSKLADLEVELVSTLPKYTDNHPKIISIRAAIDETRSKLNAEVDRVINAEASSLNPIHQNLLQGKIMAEADIAAASAQKRAIQNIMGNSEKELAELPAKEQGITRLVREAQGAQEIYVMLNKRYEEARINEVMKPEDVKVLDVAVVPQAPIKPQKMLNTIVAVILGLLAGIFWALLLEYINRPILNEREAKKYLQMPVLGIIPDFEMAGNIKRGPLWNIIRNMINLRKT